jgi:hypothetical protein
LILVSSVLPVFSSVGQSGAEIDQVDEEKNRYVIDANLSVETKQNEVQAEQDREALEIQKRLSISATWTTYLMAAQTILLGIGTIALVYTLRQTHRATVAATEATNASILIARKQSQAQFLVTVDNAELLWTSDNFEISPNISIENTGLGAAMAIYGYFAAEAVSGHTVDAGTSLRWAYLSAGHREIPPWSLERSIWRNSEVLTDQYQFFFVPAMRRGEKDWESDFTSSVVFRIHIFLEWTDTFDELCSVCITLESFDDATTWSEVERSEITLDQFYESMKYPY